MNVNLICSSTFSVVTLFPATSLKSIKKHLFINKIIDIFVAFLNNVIREVVSVVFHNAYCIL